MVEITIARDDTGEPLRHVTIADVDDPEDVSVEVESSPHTVDGTYIEDYGVEVSVLSSSVRLVSTDEKHGVVLIERDGWELDPYVMHKCLPSGLSRSLKSLGFEYDPNGEPMK